LAFVLNTDDGLNLLASGIRWNKGDRILLYRYEYPANVYPFLNQKICMESKWISWRPEDGRITVDVIKKHLKPETRLLSLSFVQFLTGFRADLTEIGKLCKERNIFFSVDAIQGLPQFIH